MQEIIIDLELKEKIPPLSKDEYAHLEAAITANGCRDSLVITTDGVLVDGHNRYEICTRLGIHYDIVEMYFEDKGAIIEWMLKNQLGRRNLEPFIRATMALELENIYSERAKKRQIAAGGAKKAVVALMPPPIAEKDLGKKTRDELAEIAGVSPRVIQKVKAIQERGSDEIKNSLQAGKISIGKAYEEITGKPSNKKTVPEEKYLALLEEFKESKDAFDEAGLIYEEMNRIVQSNDQLKACESEIKNIKTLNKQLQSRINGLIAENQAAIKQIKSLQSVIKKLEGKK